MDSFRSFIDCQFRFCHCFWDGNFLDCDEKVSRETVSWNRRFSSPFIRLDVTQIAIENECEIFLISWLQICAQSLESQGKRKYWISDGWFSRFSWSWFSWRKSSHFYLTVPNCSSTNGQLVSSEDNPRWYNRAFCNDMLTEFFFLSRL